MKIRWGILSTANIGLQKVIPAIQMASNCKVVAIASRDEEKAQKAASDLGIPKYFSSYEDLLADPEIDAIYNPLPNNLHVIWSLKALEAGKHVLCEKPIGKNTEEAQTLIQQSANYPHLKIMEAFMYRFHPQWEKTIQLIEAGKIGEVKAIQSFFSYFNIQPDNIRNQLDTGGGALMDIGCYCIQFARYILKAEPLRVMSLVNRDPVMKIDHTTSGMLDFGNGKSASFTCSTQLHPFQRLQINGTEGRIEIEIPVNAPPDRMLKISLFRQEQSKEMFIGPADQYTLQAEAFANSIINNIEVPTPLNDAMQNMTVIDALFESEKTNSWIKI